MKTTTTGLLSSRGSKHRSGTQAKAPSATRRRPAPSGLSQDELLAKIDALDWDQTVTAATVTAEDAVPNGQYPDRAMSSWRVGALVALIAAVLAALYFMLAPEPARRQAAREAPTPISALSSLDNQTPAVAPEAGAAAVAAADERRSALYAHAIAEAEAKAKAKAQEKTDARRKARETRAAERARLAALQERRQKEEARMRAEREAGEAARAAKAGEQAAVPKGPASPRELCAGEGGAIARGFCEARTCGQAEWRSHPFCVQRIEEQLRSFGQGG